MNSINASNSLKLPSEKMLGKKIKRFKKAIKPYNLDAKNPPVISKSTINQIEKITKNKKIKLEKLGIDNAENTNISTYKETSKFKLPELSLKEQYEDLINRKELILPPKYRILLKKQNYLDDFLSKTNKNMIINQ